MSSEKQLHQPWLVAVWPGMGQVASSAGYYLMAKLGMHLFSELSPEGLFDIEAVAVKDGVYQRAGLPRNRLFVWKDPRQQRDIVVFIGEAQPPAPVRRPSAEALLDPERDEPLRLASAETARPGAGGQGEEREDAQLRA